MTQGWPAVACRRSRPFSCAPCATQRDCEYLARKLYGLLDKSGDINDNRQIGTRRTWRDPRPDARREIAGQYRQAIAENPSDWWLHWKCAEFLSEMDPDPTAALQYYRQVERMVPHYAAVHERLGVCQGKLGQLDRAIESCEKSAALDPFHSYARFHLGYAYQLKGNTDKAGEQYRIAVRLEPENGPAWNNLGGILYSKGDIVEAIAIYREALEHVHDFSDLNYNLAVSLRQNGNRPEAIKELEAGLKIDPNSVKIRQLLHELRQEDTHSGGMTVNGVLREGSRTPSTVN